MTEIFKINLGKRIGCFDIPVGSTLFFDKCLLIFIRAHEYNLNLFRFERSPSLDEINCLQRVPVNNAIVEPAIVATEKNEKANIYRIFFEEPKSYDYKITLNGIFNSIGDLLLSFTYITDLFPIYTDKFGDNAFRLLSNQFIPPVSMPRRHLTSYKFYIKYNDPDNNIDCIEQTIINQLRLYHSNIDLYKINYKDGVKCESAEDIKQYLPKLPNGLQDKYKMIVICDLRKSPINKEYFLTQLFNLTRGSALFLIGSNEISNTMIYQIENAPGWINLEFRNNQIYKNNSEIFNFAKWSGNDFSTLNKNLISEIKKSNRNIHDDMIKIVESDCQYMTIIDLLFKYSKDFDYISYMLYVWRLKFPHLFSVRNVLKQMHRYIAYNQLNYSEKIKIFKYLFSMIENTFENSVYNDVPFVTRFNPIQAINLLGTKHLRELDCYTDADTSFEQMQELYFQIISHNPYGVLLVNEANINSIGENFSESSARRANPSPALTYTNKILQIKDVDKLLSCITGHTGKRLRSFFYNNVKHKPMETIYLLSYLGIVFADYNILCNELNKNINLINYHWVVRISSAARDDFKFISFRNKMNTVRDYLSKEKIKKIFNPMGEEWQFSTVYDTVVLLSENIQLLGGSFDFNECNTLIELHDKLVIENEKIKNKEIIFDNTSIARVETKFNLDNIEYEIILPKTNLDIVEFGKTFRICVGNRMYQAIHQKGSGIIAKILKNNEDYAIVHLSNSYNIEQIKSFRNANLPDFEVGMIQKYLINFIK